MADPKPIPLLSEKDIQRFWLNVKIAEPDKCWIWQKFVDAFGYGKFGLNRRSYITSRISWTLTNGSIPDGLCVLHNCPDGDNPACCNPAHLWLGTLTDNNRDRDNKGRQGRPSGDRNGSRLHPECLVRGDKHPARINPELWRAKRAGENNGRAKLTWSQVREIRALAGKLSYLKIAKQFGIGGTTVKRIIDFNTWRTM